MKYLTLILLLISCSTNKLKEYNIRPSTLSMLGSVMIEQKTHDAILELTKKSLDSNINLKSYQIIQDSIDEDDYNLLIVSHAKKSKQLKEFEKFYEGMMKNNSFKKIEKLKADSVKDDFDTFAKNFIKSKNAKKRIILVQKIILSDFPNLYYADFIAKLAILMSKYDNNYERRNIYKNVRSHLTESLLKINLYLFKDVPIELLVDAVREQNKKTYIKSRKFVENIQKKTNDFFISKIIKKMGSENIQTPSINKLTR